MEVKWQIHTRFPRVQFFLEKLTSSLSINTISCFPEMIGSLHLRKCPLNAQVWITLVYLVLSSTNGVPWRRPVQRPAQALRHFPSKQPPRLPGHSSSACVLTASDWWRLITTCTVSGHYLDGYQGDSSFAHNSFVRLMQILTKRKGQITSQYYKNNGDFMDPLRKVSGKGPQTILWEPLSMMTPRM